jgi:hypothetical protein
MNEAQADSGVAGLKPQPQERDNGWSRQRWLTTITLVFVMQLALIFALGEKQFPPRRVVMNVPQLALADNSSELIALRDPTLFALPHANDFASAIWLKAHDNKPLDFSWTEPPRPLPLAAENLGVVFARFMQTNRFQQFQLDFKPLAKSSETALPLEPVFAENSTLQIKGELAQRKLLNFVSLPSWPYKDVIVPSRVQVVVGAAGDVVSAALLPPDNPGEAASHYDAADQQAVGLARTLRFTPASRMTVGQLIFNWRTVPQPATNSPSSSP